MDEYGTCRRRWDRRPARRGRVRLGGKVTPIGRVRGRRASDDRPLVARPVDRRAEQGPAGVVADVLSWPSPKLIAARQIADVLVRRRVAQREEPSLRGLGLRRRLPPVRAVPQLCCEVHCVGSRLLRRRHKGPRAARVVVDDVEGVHDVCLIVSA